MRDYNRREFLLRLGAINSIALLSVPVLEERWIPPTTLIVCIGGSGVRIWNRLVEENLPKTHYALAVRDESAMRVLPSRIEPERIILISKLYDEVLTKALSVISTEKEFHSIFLTGYFIQPHGVEARTVWQAAECNLEVARILLKEVCLVKPDATIQPGDIHSDELLIVDKIFKDIAEGGVHDVV